MTRENNLLNLPLHQRCFILRRRHKVRQVSVSARYKVPLHALQMFEQHGIATEYAEMQMESFYNKYVGNEETIRPGEHLLLWKQYENKTNMDAIRKLDISIGTLNGLIAGRIPSKETAEKIFRKTGIYLESN